MNGTRTVVIQDIDSPTPNEFGLPPDLVAKARIRIARLAGVLGTLSIIAILLNTTLFRDDVDSVVLPQHFLAVGLALTVFVTARAKKIADMTALNIGLIYEVFLCWIVSFSAQHAAVVLFGRPPEITWTSMIIVVFPMVVPLPPSRLLFASICAAVSAPITLVALDLMDKHALSIDALIGVSISPAFAVVLAYFGSRMIYSFGLDVTRARLMGAYRLESRIGAGGMGEVWRASHSMLARPAAIKLIAPEQLGGDAYTVLTRFEQEAQATALLRSPHTVEVFDYGRSDDGSFYYVMELLDGLDLQELVNAHGPMPASRVVHILRQVCHSLGEAHAAGLVHRDVKPANIFVCKYGCDFDFVKVLDFGVVKQQKPARSLDLTQQGWIGTPAFLAPEMATGSDVDGRADIYALGCVAYWLLTGNFVFEADNPLALANKHVQEEPTPPSQCIETNIPASLEEVVMDCLRKDPAERPANAAELVGRLSNTEVAEWGTQEAKNWWKTAYPECKTD